LDKKTMHKKENIMPRYAELIYNGYWYSKERFKLQKIVDLKKNKVNGTIKLKLYKGNITIESRITNSEAYSIKNNRNIVILNAREDAVNFYSKLGYKNLGKIDVGIDIKHFHMKKDIKNYPSMPVS